MSDLIIKSLTKTFPSKVAVNHINMHIKVGQFVAFLGPNGAGKSTTVGMITGLTQPTSGQITLGSEHPQSPQYKRQFGVVFQNSVLDPTLTVQQNLELRAQMYTDFKSEWLNKLITDFALTSILNQDYGTLSGGQRRRVDITRALIHQPQVLVLDEPSTGLDIQTRNTIWTALLQLRQTTGLTVILTTHYLEEAEAADYVYIIDHGDIIAEDSVAKLKQQYAQYQLILQSNDYPALLKLLDRTSLPYQQSDQAITVAVPDAHTAITTLDLLRPYITTFESREGDMNDIFVTLTGKEIR
ncbi:ABC transporter ATP-binding protein [Lacticaseibacillus saniviri]